MTQVSSTYGALLIGGLLAVFFSGIVCTQCFLYFRSFYKDRWRVKALVAALWFLDFLHSTFVVTTVWYYLIDGFNNTKVAPGINWSVSLKQVTISITGILTFIIHFFFAHRVWTLSKSNVWLTGLIMGLAFLRMLSAFGTVIQMSRLHTWVRFHEVAAWSFTTGLVISACVDFLITLSLVYYLSQSRTGFSNMDYIIDTIMLYAIENGLLTSISVLASLICWLTMPTNFIFLALHFVISKMYANSLLATLNARRHIQDKSSHSERHWRDNSNNLHLPTMMTSASLRRGNSDATQKEPPPSTSLQINVEKSIHCVTDIGSSAVEIDSIDPPFLSSKGELPTPLCITHQVWVDNSDLITACTGEKVRALPLHVQVY
ncbi:hypothetical protein BC835DRAFT_1529197 [Cytidiella melzeri]|nr:hypothetical protein BC835DRAFT_1529197 [Cytidiella melzeri]